MDTYRTENQHLTESIAGLQTELLDTQQNFEDQSIEYVEASERLKILGFTYIGARIRALNNFNRIDQRYTYQRNRAYRAERALRECHTNGAMLYYWQDQIII